MCYGTARHGTERCEADADVNTVQRPRSRIGSPSESRDGKGEIGWPADLVLADDEIERG